MIIFNFIRNAKKLFSSYLDLDNEGHPTHVISSFQHKHSYYYGGKTYFLWMKTDALNNKNMVFSFDHSTKAISQSYDTQSTNASSDDLHSHGSIFITTSGTIIVATVSRIVGQGDKGIIISRASVNDISSWTPIAQGEIDNSCNYCQISQVTSGRIFLWYRKNPDSLKIMYSDDDGVTWSTPVLFFSFETGNYDWCYPYGIHNNIDDKIHLIINRRYYDTYPTASIKFPQRYYLKTSDGDTFSNIDDTWSKEVSAEGYIYTSDVVSNAMIENAVSMDSIIWNSGGVIGSDGNVYLLSEKEGGGLNFTYWNGSAWSINEITPRQGAHVANTSRISIIHLSGNIFRVFCLDTISGKDQLVSYITTDKGSTWSYEKQYTDSQFTHYLRADLTDNIQTSRKGLLATIKGDGTGDNAEIFIQEI